MSETAASKASVLPSKRGLDGQQEVSASKRQRQQRQKVPYHHHHSIHHRQQQRPQSCEPVFVAPESVEKMLIDSIKTVVEEEGLKQDVQDPVIESMALEALYEVADEFVLALCASVRRSMLAARRTVPIAPDFEAAIATLGLPRPDDQLEPYKTKPLINPPLSYPTPPPEGTGQEEGDDPFHSSHDLPTDFLGANLDGKAALKRYSHTPASLPPLPLAHTYMSTAVFGQRETDSRKIRELATEEGKLGEQALRKLAGAVKIGAAPTTPSHPVPAAGSEHESKPNKARPSTTGKARARRRPVDDAATEMEESGFERAVGVLLQAEPEGFELGPIVTAEKALRMPDEGQIKRRAKVNDSDGDGNGNGNGREAKHDAGQTATRTPPAIPEEMEL